MIPVGKLLLAAFTSVVAYGLWRLSRFVYHEWTSPMRHLRGPKGTSWIYGNMGDVWNVENSPTLLGEWVKQYGSTLRYKGLFNSNGMFTVDTRAINHVLTHSNDYQKSAQARYNLSQILGKGVLFVEGAQHRQQRRILNPAFGPVQIRELTDIFVSKAARLRDVLSSEIAMDPTGAAAGTRLDVMPWLSRLTLDIIGLAGFNYNFDALNANEKPNELHEAFATVVVASQRAELLRAWQGRFPILRLLPNERARRIQVAHAVMTRIGEKLLSDAKTAARASAKEKGEIEKSSLHGRDLLSLLIKANMGTDIPEGQRLSDEDVLSQVPTFLAAGHETTSTATTWALYEIAKAPKLQSELREEIISMDTETPSMDELMALPYLDAFVRETLRVHSPVPGTMRIAMKDDVLPLEKPYKDKYGAVHNSIRIRKGDSMLIPILAINRLEEFWGPDAHEFRPERWKNIPDAVSQIPGVWSHQMTFLGGPRACIGYRFSLVEMKAILFILLRAFEFELAVPVADIGKKATMVQRPILRSDPKTKPQLPLLIRPYKRS